MRTHIILGLSLCLFTSLNVMAEDLVVQSLSQGACWYDQGELLKIVSFNDRESLTIERENLDIVISELINPESLKNKSRRVASDLSLHCGGYGASLVVKTEYQGLPACLWLKMDQGKLEVRSLGGLEDTKGDLCDGYKWGELIVGLKSLGQKDLLMGEELKSVVQSVSAVGGTTVKVTLKAQYRGRETEAMMELKKIVEMKYVEFNYYQHHVGEVVSLK
ncbi:MAG: hypothetical protein K2Q18_05385 [Bdellovibrionales bacterium]|nr:hypothetical protein [Bdellovibrionales bacterium]